MLIYEKSFFTFVLALTFILTGVYLTGCGPDHIDFDMFGKEYSIASNQVATILYSGDSEDDRQTISNWKNWINENASKLSYGPNSSETFDAQTLIESIENQHFISNAKITVTSSEQSGNPRKGRVKISGEALDTVELDFEASEDTEYEGNYSYGNFKDPVSGNLSLTVSWDAKVKGINISYYTNDFSYSNYFKANLYLDGKEFEFRVGYDLLSVNSIN